MKILALSDQIPEIVGIDHPDWDRFVEAQPKGSVFHSSSMIRAFRHTAGYEPLTLAATGGEGQIIAMLSSFRIQVLGSLPALTSRVVQFAEPLCVDTPEGITGLTKLIAHHDKLVSSKSVMCEIRPISEPTIEKKPLQQNGYERQDYINYVIRLDQGKDAIWSKLNKRLRQKLRSSWRKGVEVVDDNSVAGVRRFYGLLKGSYARARVPLADVELFENTLKFLPPDQVRIRTAMFQGEPVSAVITLVYGDRMFSWYGGTKRINSISGFACIVWEDIAWGCENGLKYYDFGGAGWPYEDYGPRRFKRNFGGDETRYGRYIKPYSSVRLRVAEFAYQISRQLGFWSKSDEATAGNKLEPNRTTSTEQF